MGKKSRIKIEKRLTVTSPALRKPMAIQVLNVGEGDLKISFDKGNRQDMENAKRVLTDLLRQGFAVMVEVGRNERGPIYQRVQEFDPETAEYVVMGAPETPTLHVVEGSVERKPVRRPRTRVPADTPAIAVARSAGGYDPNIIGRIRRGGSASALEVRL